MQNEAIIRNTVAERGWKILSLEETPVVETSKGKDGGIKLVLDTSDPKSPKVRHIPIPKGISGQIKDGVIRTFVPRDIISLIRLLPSIRNHCSGVNSANTHCPLRFKCQLLRDFFDKVKAGELNYGLRNPFVGTAPFIITGTDTKCSAYIPNHDQSR